MLLAFAMGTYVLPCPAHSFPLSDPAPYLLFNVIQTLILETLALH